MSDLKPPAYERELEFVRGLDKLLKDTGFIIVQALDGAIMQYDENYGNLLAYDSRKMKHVLITPDGILNGAGEWHR